jgi:hypothetical protein
MIKRVIIKFINNRKSLLDISYLPKKWFLIFLIIIIHNGNSDVWNE